VLSNQGIRVRRDGEPRVPWYVWVLWSFSFGWPAQGLVVGVGVGLGVGTKSTGVAVAGAVVTFVVAWFGFPRLVEWLLRRHAAG
jgi:hypothetical protein